VIKILAILFSPYGKINRLEFFLGIFLLAIISMLLSLCMVIVLFLDFRIIGVLIALLCFYSGVVCLVHKRLNDLNLSFAWVLPTFVSSLFIKNDLVMLFFLISTMTLLLILLFFPGDKRVISNESSDEEEAMPKEGTRENLLQIKSKLDDVYSQLYILCLAPLVVSVILILFPIEILPSILVIFSILQWIFTFLILFSPILFYSFSLNNKISASEGKLHKFNRLLNKDNNSQSTENYISLIESLFSLNRLAKIIIIFVVIVSFLGSILLPVLGVKMFDYVGYTHNRILGFHMMALFSVFTSLAWFVCRKLHKEIKI